MHQELKQESKIRKWRNLENSKKILNEYGIEYTEYNNGIHFKIDTGKDFIDYWPSTGKWMHGKIKGRGIFRLIEHIENL